MKFQILVKNIEHLFVELYLIIKQLLNKSKEFIKFKSYFKLNFPLNSLMSLLLKVEITNTSFYNQSAIIANY